MYKEVIVNLQTNEIVEQEMSAEVSAEIDAATQKQIELEAAEQTKLAEIATAKASLLDRLGITADEAKLLLS